MMDEAASGPTDTAKPDRGRMNSPSSVVGIGASAGGIYALRRLLPAIEPGCGSAFVVVMHLDPAHESQLPGILARSCRIPVVAAEDDVLLEPSHVYVIPPNVVMTVQADRLRLTALPQPPMSGALIDEFLISLAADRDGSSACVILSGTGSDGTLGLRAIKDSGGLTIAQAEAEYDGMMRSAVGTGLVDFILRAEDIPAKLAEFFKHASRAERTPAQAAEAERAAHLPEITALLRNQTGHDFSKYKERTIIRRLERRMNVLQIEDVASFVERMRQDPREATLLFQDLLIGVTSFFRDPSVFAVIEREVIPGLFRDKVAADTVRVWVPACSTGEEAYSWAILLREYALKLVSPPRLQIFASDIDDGALEIARQGRYPATIGKDVPTARLGRYFTREDGTYRIAAELREICLFSSHNLLRDAPFSRLDLISCRNLLIYLQTDLQNQVIPLFHYALNPTGYLLLGTSENVTRHSRMFAVIDKVNRIFQRRAQPNRALPDFPLAAPRFLRTASAGRSSGLAVADNSLKAAAERQLLERFGPAYVVINSEGDLLHASVRTGKFLELPAGAPDINIYSMARSGLRVELRALVHKSLANEQTVAQHGVVVGTNGGRQELSLVVQPLPFGGGSERLFMVVFQEQGPVKLGSEPDLAGLDVDTASDSFRQLEVELRATRERLQTTTEELESSNEELKSSNEELSSINEELQSSNEELETSKEELQSINEELQTVNGELSTRVEELSRANNDITNLLESTQIATVFLDRDLLVKGFTPAAKDLFRLVESDAGRPIMHVRSLFELETMQDDAERVLRTLAAIERQVVVRETKTKYVLRLLPYRTVDNVISGVVMTFNDVTRIVDAEARIAELTLALQGRVNDLETLLDLVPVGVMIADGGANPSVVINQYGARLLGEPDGQLGLRPAMMPWRLMVEGEEIPQQEQPLWRAIRTGQAVSLVEARLIGGTGDHTASVIVSAVPLLDSNGVARGAISALSDISPHKRAAAEQVILLNELQHRVKNILATIISLANRLGKNSPSVATFKDSFLPRLLAMGRMHDLLSNGAWQAADLRSLLLTALELHTSSKDNILLRGEPVELPPNLGPTVGMIFFELATNAVKYGALSNGVGVVDVSWTVMPNDGAGQTILSLTWTERGGPPILPARPERFGTSFVRRSVEHDLDGRIELDLAEEGVRCTIVFPLPEFRH